MAKIEQLEGELIQFDSLSPSERYRAMVESIVPRPIGWISTFSPEGVINLAPFSYFSGVGSRPPLVMVSIGRRKKGVDEPKDTYRNLLETGKGAISIPTLSQWREVDKTGAVLPSSEGEPEKFGIDMIRLHPDYPPIVKGVHRAFLVSLYGTFDREELATIPFFLKIDHFYTTGKEFQPLARLGSGYGGVSPILEEE
jgi:flavin reductase (DIM6/NTAB) family NADH-FMN oxidoreductase RutF